jgi:hypothetical protein
LNIISFTNVWGELCTLNKKTTMNFKKVTAYDYYKEKNIKCLAGCITDNTTKETHFYLLPDAKSDDEVMNLLYQIGRLELGHENFGVTT